MEAPCTVSGAPATLGSVTSTRSDTRSDALEILRTLVGRDDADFHEGQFEAIETLVDGRRRALVVQRTGWGKSAVYFVATLLLGARARVRRFWFRRCWP